MITNVIKYTLFACLLVSFLTVSAQKTEYGLASYYNDNFQDSKTANGEFYDKNKLTAAHRTLPFNTTLRVTRLDNGKAVTVRVNDRGPFRQGHVVDLSRKAAAELGIITLGKARVKIEVVKKGSGKEVKTVAKAKETTKKALKDSENTAKGETKRVVPKSYSQTTKKSGTAKGVSRTSAPQNGLFKVEAMAHDKAGYGVQVGSFTDFKLLVSESAKLRKRGFKNVLVSVEGAKYKLILGPFEDTKKAQAYKKNLKRKYKINGFMVNLATLNH